MTLPVFQSAAGVEFDVELLQLKDFIISGQSAQWCVYADNNSSYPFDTYEQAKAKFDSLELENGASLVLWTRIGTSVTFYRREAKR